MGYKISTLKGCLLAIYGHIYSADYQSLTDTEIFKDVSEDFMGADLAYYGA